MSEKKRKRVKHRSEEPLRVNELIREIEGLEEKLAATESRLSKQIVQLEEHVNYLESLIRAPHSCRLDPIGPSQNIPWKPFEVEVNTKWQKMVQEQIKKKMDFT